MPCLYITEQGAVLRKSGDRVIVQKEDAVLGDVPADVDTILLYGNVQMTSHAVAELLQHGIEVSFFSLGGKLHGHLTPNNPKNIVLRMRQYEISHDRPGALHMAQAVVRGKVRNSAAVLRRYHKNHPTAVTLAEVHAVEECIARAEQAESLEELLGVEGNAAARYFESFAAMAPPAAGFTGRNRRPPRDPMNALLSFGYVLIGNELQSLLDGMGFDPYIGFYHQVQYGRPSLALDLLEEFRAPLVDRFSINLFNLGVLSAADFEDTPEGGVLLRHEARKRFFAALEKELTTPIALDGEELSFRDLFRRQSERLARSLGDRVPYESFRWPAY
jgi:CRISPR-associated protein Cas1